jgi:hypothetical protein
VHSAGFSLTVKKDAMLLLDVGKLPEYTTLDLGICGPSLYHYQDTCLLSIPPEIAKVKG